MGEKKYKEFRVVEVLDKGRIVYGEYDCVFGACKEANRVGALVEVRNTYSGVVVETFSKDMVSSFVSYGERRGIV